MTCARPRTDRSANALHWKHSLARATQLTLVVTLIISGAIIFLGLDAGWWLKTRSTKLMPLRSY
jgi:hypothetical protein